MDDEDFDDEDFDESPSGADREWDEWERQLPPVRTATERREIARATIPAGAWFTVIGGAVAAIGSFLPWGSVTGLVPISRNAFQLGDHYSTTSAGPIVLVLAIITVVIGITRLMSTDMPNFIQRSSIVTGVVIGWIAFSSYSSISDWANTVNTTPSLYASVGFGLWITAIGGLVAIVGGLVLRQSR